MRGINSRLARLEALHPPCTDCPECGYPSRAVMRVVITTHDKPMPRCPNGHALSEDGVPLPRVYKRIILPDREQWP